MLDLDIKNQLKSYLELLEKDVLIKLSVDEYEASKELESFINEVAELSSKINIQKEDLKYTPSFSLSSEDISGVTFAGIPMGHEFESFVLALLQVGGRAPKISDAQKKRILSINKNLEFETIVSLSCHNCPDVVQSLNIISVLNNKVSHTMINGSAFQNLVDERGVLAVPSVFLNGEEFLAGKQTLDTILDTILGNQNEDIDISENIDVLVIGGGPAGGMSAIYSSRKGLKTVLIAKNFGGQVVETLGIENILGTIKTEGPKFMQDVKNQLEYYNIETHNNIEAVNISKTDKICVELSNGQKIYPKTVIIATGARWRLLGIPGENEFRNKGVAFCAHCDGPLFENKNIAVIGGGNSGVETAIDLSSIGKKIYLLEFADSLKADNVLQEKLRELDNVEVITNAATSALEGDSTLKSLKYKDRITNEEKELQIDGCFIQIGLAPNTEWLKGSIELNNKGEIITENDGATSMDGVFAAGDCANTEFKQIIIAAGSGANASLGAFNYSIRN